MTITVILYSKWLLILLKLFQKKRNYNCIDITFYSTHDYNLNWSPSVQRTFWTDTVTQRPILPPHTRQACTQALEPHMWLHPSTSRLWVSNQNQFEGHYSRISLSLVWTVASHSIVPVWSRLKCKHRIVFWLISFVSLSWPKCETKVITLYETIQWCTHLLKTKIAE